MMDEHDENGNHDHEHEHEDEANLAEMLGLDLDSQTQVFIEMRGQNLELLKVAAQVAGYSGPHAPLKPNELRSALKSIWELYSEFYHWIDPEDSENEDDDEEMEEE